LRRHCASRRRDARVRRPNLDRPAAEPDHRHNRRDGRVRRRRRTRHHPQPQRRRDPVPRHDRADWLDQATSPTLGVALPGRSASRSRRRRPRAGRGAPAHPAGQV